MTYLQFMIKCLNFFKNSGTDFDRDDYYYFWLHKNDDDAIACYNSRVKKIIMYLILLEANDNVNKSNYLLKILEDDLSYSDINLDKTIEKDNEKTLASLSEDPYLLDQICLLEQDELSEQEQEEVLSELKKKMQDNDEPVELVYQIYESAIHTAMETVTQIIPELFFTDNGYRYIGEEFQIKDPELRQKCYEYLRDNINHYNTERVYKVDESIYSSFYEPLEDNDDELPYDDELSDDDDKIRGEVDIYGMDIDNYDILYYSVTLLTVMLGFVKTGEYDKLNRMIELDALMTNNYFGRRLYYDKTLIEAIYQPKAMEYDLHDEIVPIENKEYFLNFFLSDNDFTREYNLKHLALIISHCFDAFDPSPLQKIYKNIDNINQALAITDNAFNSVGIRDFSKDDEAIKQLVKVRRDNI